MHSTYPAYRPVLTNVRALVGYPPDKLHHVLLESKTAADPSGKGKRKETDTSWVQISSSQDATTGLPRVVYEIKADSDRLEPRLRLLVNSPKEHTSELPLSSVTSLENASSSSIGSLDEQLPFSIANVPSTSYIALEETGPPPGPVAEHPPDEVIEISYAPFLTSMRPVHVLSISHIEPKNQSSRRSSYPLPPTRLSSKR